MTAAAGPALFKHVAANGFDVLTRRKGTTKDIEAKPFQEVSHTDEHGETQTWTVADTLVDLPLTTTRKTGEVFQIRQISKDRARQRRRWHPPNPRPHHREEPPYREAVYRMGNRWRPENQFRYARVHFELGSFGLYIYTEDDLDWPVPNPAKTRPHQKVRAARKHQAELAAGADSALEGVSARHQGRKK